MVITPSNVHPTFVHQMLVASVLFLIMMVESSLGYFLFFHGAAPKVLVTMVFLMAVFDKENIHLANLVLIGVIFDSLHGAPIGYTSSSLIIVNIIGLIGKRRFQSNPLSYLWLDFTMVMALIIIYCWLCISIYYTAFPAIGPLVFQYSISVLLFPLVISLYQGIQYLTELVGRLR